MINYVAIALSAVAILISVIPSSDDGVARLEAKVETLQIVANAATRSAEIIAMELVEDTIASHVEEYHK